MFDPNKKTNFSRCSCFDLPPCQELRPLDSSPRQSSPFEDGCTARLAFWSTLLGKSSIPSSWAAALIGIHWASEEGRKTHSTLINTWPHYLSHVVESRRGKFYTALLSGGMEPRALMFISLCVWNLKSVYICSSCGCVWVCESVLRVHWCGCMFQHAPGCVGDYPPLMSGFNKKL